MKSGDTKDTIPHPFPFSREEKGKLEPPLSAWERGGGEDGHEGKKNQKLNCQVLLKPDAQGTGAAAPVP